VDISNNLNSAIISGTMGLKKASDGLTQSATNLANLSVKPQTSSDPREFLANATLTQLGSIKQTLPQASAGITNDILGLSVNLTNAQASSKVLGTANDTVGTILDILA
jgi:hypothetical protein